MNIKKSYYLILILLLTLSGCYPKSNDITIALDYPPNTNYIGIYTAIKKGYFKQQGINIKLLNPSSVSVEDLIANHKADLGISYSENLLLANHKGRNLKSIYAFYHNNDSGFISKKSKNITSIKDFANKTYCGWGSESERKIIRQLLKNNDVNPDSLKIINTDLSINNDYHDRCDIFWSYQGWGNVLANNQDIAYNYLPLSSFNLNFYTPILITNANNNNPMLKKVLLALTKGVNDAYNNIDEASNIFKEYDPSINSNIIKESLLTYKNNINPSGYQDINIWNKFINFCIEANIINQIPQQEVFSNEFVNN